MTITADSPSSETPSSPGVSAGQARPGPDWRIAGLALALLLGGIAAIGGAVGGEQAALYALG
ncbi:MAG TPA: hypothetical protein VIK47_03285, partial [Kiloniellales bacterium]